MKFYIRTLGCKMNWLDSARLAAALQSAGNVAVNDEEKADYIFVNTCTVTSEADRKSRQTVNRAGQLQKQVAVMGCGPRVDQGDWQAQNDGALIFSDEDQMLSHFGVESDELLLPLNSRTRLPVAIQTGCDNECSFCITRIARGAHRSLPTEQVVRQIDLAYESGVREVILTGINLAAWGCDDSRAPQQAKLHELLEAILQRTEMPRIRLSSIGPEYIQPAFFEVYADERICDYLHISLQSGCNSVLKGMQRGHGTREVEMIAEQARAVRPDTALAADLIAGFPGETEDEHRETLAFVEKLRFAKLHVFPFSIREGTPAAELPEQLSSEIKKQRAAELRDLGKKLRQQFIDSQVGKTVQVLVEANGQGLSANYLRLRTSHHPQGEILAMPVSRDQLLERD